MLSEFSIAAKIGMVVDANMISEISMAVEDNMATMVSWPLMSI